MSFTYESSRSKAYDEDLRWRIVYQSEGIGLNKRKIAKNLGMDRSTVSRILSLFHSTGAVSKKVFAKDRSFRILTEPGQLLILHLVTSKPGVYLREIQEELLLQLMIEVAISTICRFLNKNGFSYQKMAHIAIQRDEYFRQKYLMDVSVYQPEMFIFIDETRETV